MKPAANKPPTRRGVMKNLLAAGAVAAVGGAGPATKSATKSATTSTTKAATSRAADAISPADVAAADKIAGRDYYNDAERKMTAENLAGTRDRLKALRARPIDPNIEPAVHFDPRVAGMKIPSGESSFSLSDTPTPEFNGDIKSLAFASIADLSRLIHAKKITSLDLTKMYLERLKEIGPKLNCVVTLIEDLALEQAHRADEELAAGKDRGPLHGIPWGAKDLLATKGIPTTWGAKPYIDQVFEEDATVVRKLHDVGAVLLAKLSLGELCMGDVWFNGLTRCPWDPKSGSSGSSAGPCAAVAAGLVGFSIGSETLGSIVSPCMVNGTTGLRPTYGRVSRYGAMPLARTMDKLGPIARGVEDCAMILSAIHGADENDLTAADVPFKWDSKVDLKSLRVGIDATGFDLGEIKSEESKKLYGDALDRLKSLVGELVPVKLPPAKDFSGIAGMVIAVESASSFTELVASGRVRELKQQGEGSWPNTFRTGAMTPAADYLRAMRVRTLLQREMAKAMKDVDLYVTIPYAGPTIAFTNLTGHPSVITRAGMMKGRPKMIEFIGKLYREDAVLRVALEFERETKLQHIWPNMEKAFS
jgi:Asp-tRNA(Asn)/Glu-tRNA(Gln) amidotransferase A subunit family amidase